MYLINRLNKSQTEIIPDKRRKLLSHRPHILDRVQLNDRYFIHFKNKPKLQQFILFSLPRLLKPEDKHIQLLFKRNSPNKKKKNFGRKEFL